jgi:hypothetical protein
MKQITNLEEKHEFIKKAYSGNYLNTLRDTDPKYYNKVIKTHYIFLLDDGNYLVHEIDSVTVTKVLYYDDETERPEKTEEYFTDYNMHLNSPLRFYENKKLYIYKSNSGNDEYVTIAHDQYGERLREATEEETNTIMELRNAANDEYLKRLKAYYNRYSHNIRVRGYWANR